MKFPNPPKTAWMATNSSKLLVLNMVLTTTPTLVLWRKKLSPTLDSIISLSTNGCKLLMMNGKLANIIKLDLMELPMPMMSWKCPSSWEVPSNKSKSCLASQLWPTKKSSNKLWMDYSKKTSSRTQLPSCPALMRLLLVKLLFSSGRFWTKLPKVELVILLKLSMRSRPSETKFLNLLRTALMEMSNSKPLDWNTVSMMPPTRVPWKRKLLPMLLFTILKFTNGWEILTAAGKLKSTIKLVLMLPHMVTRFLT